MNDIEIALEDLDTLVEIARQHTGIASWLGLVQSALIMKEALEKQLNGGWISVSEGLPEKSDVYLATFLEEGKRYVERFYYSDFMGWMMPVAWQDEGRIENIIAWQPLPEPYKEVENE